jgi:uncharacterized protein YbbC (DUF1343 family)
LVETSLRTPVRTGLERLLDGEVPALKGASLGLIFHPASVTPRIEPADEVIARHPDLSLCALFGPQHGARGEKQDNMVESDAYQNRRALPVHSLYGAVRKPTPDMLRGLDVLLFDLQDVGTRVYTFVWTMVLAMEACRDAGVRFVVLDRPNPIGGRVLEGPILRMPCASFVGMHPIPLRHGLTAGELARLVNVEFGLGCDLEVVPCEGWRRGMWFDQCGLPFVMPSPNLPTLDSCIVYPGMVLLEGTNLSEGRGTTRPFELFGAPYLDAQQTAARLESFELAGVRFRACHFEPTFQKHCGALCGGAQLHVTDREALRSVEVALAILRVAADLAPRAFGWRSPPYEYEFERQPIDLLYGSAELREGIDRGATPAELLSSVDAELAEFAARARPYLLYPE